MQLNVKKTHGFLNYKIQSDNYNIDLAHCRTEKYLYPGELPTWEKSNIIKDLFRRDITINALAIEIQEKDFKICTEALIKARTGYKCEEIYSHEKKRMFGTTKVDRVKDGYLMLRNIFSLWLKK